MINYCGLNFTVANPVKVKRPAFGKAGRSEKL
jgi:hypothetical protein